MQVAKKTFPGAGKFDSINSTYKHEILLHNGFVLTGYSKGLLSKEPQDKTVVLIKVILRLYNSGYLDKSVRIDFHLKDFLNASHELVLTLYPRSYSFGNNQKYTLNTKLNTFLNKFYMQVKTGTVDTKSLIPTKIIQTEEEIFSLQRRRFNSEPELLEFIIKKKAEGYEDGLIMRFFYKYRERYLQN